MNSVLIVGAGPAGAACGWKLASEGITSILADRSEFPRTKICAGVVSKRGENALIKSGMLKPEELNDLTVAVHDTMTVINDLKELRTCSQCTPPMRIVDRREFDSFLRRRAVEAGAEPLTDRLVKVSEDKAVFASGRNIHFSRLIGADGASSTVRKSITAKKNVLQSPSLSTVVQLSPKAVEPFRAKGLSIFFFRELYGYGWLFPRGDDLTIGVASHGTSHPDLRKMLRRILRYSGLPARCNMAGAVLPAGRQPIGSGHGRVILAGDAAGLCDRITGEGIASAIESGLASAAAVIDGRDSWSRKEDFAVRISLSLRYRKYLYSRLFRPLAMKALAESDRWYRKYWNIVSGSSDYTELIRKPSSRFKALSE
ncbi:hypothetical protein CSA37_12965 [Candidatus Fermentibacteria bacterium]|nr:MAG: hypothetical protein CSA37_12965 [Candidatus Fermentibacteria bacterium]